MLQINIIPVVENRTYETLYFDSKPGIYKMQDTDDYYLYIGEKLILIYDSKLSVITNVENWKTHQFTFVTDKYTVDSNQITFVDSPRSFKLKDSPPKSGWAIRLHILNDNKPDTGIFIIPRNPSYHPAIIQDNGELVYSAEPWSYWKKTEYSYSVVGKVSQTV